ncbi:MAG: hypothetical protein ACRDKL_01270, partial [Solirubrobacteraceae bacterium]
PGMRQVLRHCEHHLKTSLAVITDEPTSNRSEIASWRAKSRAKASKIDLHDLLILIVARHFSSSSQMKLRQVYRYGREFPTFRPRERKRP